MHSEKQCAQRSSTDAGMQIDRSFVQSADAFSSISFSLEPDSKDTVESEQQREKQFLQRISTVDDRQMERSCPQQKNAPSSIRVSREPGSNVKLDNSLQP
jgi:hypothetical protein